MKILIGGYAINTKHIIAISNITNKRNKYDRFSVMFINRKTITFDCTCTLSEETMNKKQLESLRSQLIKVWGHENDIKHIMP